MSLGERTGGDARQLEIVLTLSRFCNQRCVYCYQHVGRGDPARMTLEELEIIFGRVESFCRRHRPAVVRFVWHGGEPLLAPPDYFFRALDCQRAVFREPGYRLVNSLQSNLLVLDPEHLRLLREFDVVGTSMDVVGGLRVDAEGRPTERRVLANLARVRELGIWTSAIAVLSRAGLPRIAEIYRVFRELDLQFRLLPLRGGTPAGAEEHEITGEEARTAFCELADLWLDDDRFVDAWPVTFLIGELLVSRLGGFAVRRYVKEEWEPVLAVDVDGQVFGYGHAEDRRNSYGSLLDSPLEDLLRSEGWRQAVDEARAKQAACAGCDYFGNACTGFPVAEGVEATDGGETPRCIAFQGLLRHLDRRLRERGLLDRASGDLTEAGRVAAESIRHNQQQR